MLSKRNPRSRTRIDEDPDHDAHGVNSLAFIVWHAVEFSRFGRTPKQAVSGRFRGNPAMLAGCLVGCNGAPRPCSRGWVGRSVQQFNRSRAARVVQIA
jgi:hypothetical protein